MRFSVYGPVIGLLMVLNVPLVIAGEQFNANRLKSLGLAPSVGDYFSGKPRFMPGLIPLTLYVNGNSSGELPVLFNKQGELCVTPLLLDALAQEDGGESDDDCVLFAQKYPEAVVRQIPAENRLDIVLPPDVTQKTNNTADRARKGGHAALLNYNWYNMRNRYAVGYSTNRYLNLESGFNLSNWAVRSHQNYSESGGRKHFTWTDLYAYRDLPDWKTQFQAGQLNLSSSLAPGFSFTGIQMIPKRMQEEIGSGVEVSGIASTDFSRVDVRQNGSLIYSTLVPAGPFTLKDVPVTSLTNDLHMTVTSEGKMTTITIPAAVLQRRTQPNLSGLSLALGKYRDISDVRSEDAPTVLAVSSGLQLIPGVGLSAATILTGSYQNVATEVNWKPVSTLLLKAQLATSQDKHHGKRGIQHTSTVQWNPEGSNNFSLFASGSRYSSGYRDLSESLSETSKYNYDSYSIGATWQPYTFGSISLSTSQNRNEGYQSWSSSRSTNLTWSHTLFGGDISINWMRQKGIVAGKRNTDNNSSQGRNDTNSLFINWSRSFSGRSYNGYYRNTNNYDVLGIRTSGKLDSTGSYSLSAETPLSQTSTPGVFASINENLHYTMLSVSAGARGEQERNVAMTLTGAIVGHRNGVTFSPYDVGETFSIASVTPPRAGVEIITGQGPVWTDRKGRAIIPTMNAWQASSVELNTEKLPQQIDVVNGYQRLIPGYASVNEVNFHILDNRRIMLEFKSGVPRGSYVTNLSGTFITTVVEDNKLFINDISATPELELHRSDTDDTCHVKYMLPERSADNVVYESINASCIKLQ